MCIDTASVGGLGRVRPTIHSEGVPKCVRKKDGLLFREKSNALATAQTADLEGKPDILSPLSFALGHLGAIQSEEGPEIGLAHPLPEAEKMKQSNKAPVFLTAAKVEMVHEPNEGDGFIPFDMSQHKVFKETFPEPQKNGPADGMGTRSLDSRT